MATDAAGFLYVGIRRADYDTAHTGVLKLDRDWKIVAAIGFDKPGDPVFNAVHDLAVGATARSTSPKRARNASSSFEPR